MRIMALGARKHYGRLELEHLLNLSKSPFCNE